MVDEKKVREEYRILTKSLISRKLTITTMESCTAGQIASLITDTEGSSEILKGAFVTYSNEAKIMMGVSRETIEKFSVYSQNTAIEMAKACKEKFSSDIGIGVSGTFGNVDTENSESSTPGKVYFAIAIKDECFSYTLSLPFQESRLMYKLLVAEKIYEKLSFLIYKKYVQPSS